MAVRFQSGIPKTAVRSGRKANGLLLPGVVTATYVTDTTGHPRLGNANNPPVAVYCDVLVYPSIGGQRWFGLRHVLVSQEVSGLHRGRIWRPRATTMDLLDDLDIEGGSNPAYMDGDHVLIGFINDNLGQPVIIRALPHPSTDLGREDAPLGQRMKLVDGDKDPDFFRHHGVHWGVADNGDFIVDSRFANDGALDDKGYEAAPPVGGEGAQTHDLPQDAKFEAVFWDMSTPASPVEVFRVSFRKDGVVVSMTGKAAKTAAVAEYLETMYGTLKTWLEAITVPTGTGPSGTPINSPAPSWDSNINSGRLTIPDN